MHAFVKTRARSNRAALQNWRCLSKDVVSVSFLTLTQLLKQKRADGATVVCSQICQV